MSHRVATRIAPSLNGRINRGKNELSARGYLRYFNSEYYRVGTLELINLEQSLSERDKQIILSISRLKVLSTNQIRRLFFPYPEHKSRLGAERICQSTLMRLIQDKVLQRSNRQIGGLHGGSRAYIYRLGPVGARLLENKTHPHDLETSSTLFLAHTLAINEIFVELNELHNLGKIKLVNIETEPYCWRLFMHNFGAREILKPDMFVWLINPITNTEYFRFIELDRGTSHPKSIENKAKIYERYYYSGNEQSKNKIFPGVLWVVPDDARKNRLDTALKTLNKAIPGLHSVIVNNQAVSVISGISVVK